MQNEPSPEETQRAAAELWRSLVHQDSGRPILLPTDQESWGNRLRRLLYLSRQANIPLVVKIVPTYGEVQTLTLEEALSAQVAAPMIVPGPVQGPTTRESTKGQRARREEGIRQNSGAGLL